MMLPRRLRSLAETLALFAALFGGLAYGTGNMLQLALDPAGAMRAHGGAGAAGADDFALICAGAHGEHARPGKAPRAPEPLLPAHCLFCLDGIAPQPVELLIDATGTALAPVRPRADRVVAAPRCSQRRYAGARGPPPALA